MLVAEIFPTVLRAWFVMAAVAFTVLWVTPAPYGRFRREGLGPDLSGTVGWLLVELPAPLIFAAAFVVGRRQADPVAVCFLVLWQLHYLHRAFVYPFRLRGADNRMPLLLVLFGVLFNVVNGSLNGGYLFLVRSAYPVDWLLEPRFLVGVTLFLVGLIVNIRADSLLLRLRAPGERGYKVPRGGPYRFVSCPNYAGEILEWFGWALATWSLAGLSMAVWTAANLVPRALAYQRWYREEFPDYPPGRKALVPFLL